VAGLEQAGIRIGQKTKRNEAGLPPPRPSPRGRGGKRKGEAGGRVCFIDRAIMQDQLFIDLLDGEGDLIGTGGEEGMGFDQAGEADGGKTE
jgi:hypothetical protein